MKRLAATALLATAATATACVPPPAPQTCAQAVDRIWPASSRAWAHRVVWRESRGDSRADNPRSTASGCWQLLAVHRPRFVRLGYQWRDRYDPVANTRVALDPYREQGTRPWGVS